MVEKHLGLKRMRMMMLSCITSKEISTIHAYNDNIRSPNATNEISDQLDFSKKIIYLIWVDRYAPDKQAGDVKGRAGGASERGTTWIYPFNFDRQRLEDQ